MNQIISTTRIRSRHWSKFWQSDWYPIRLKFVVSSEHSIRLRLFACLHAINNKWPRERNRDRLVPHLYSKHTKRFLFQSEERLTLPSDFSVVFECFHLIKKPTRWKIPLFRQEMTQRAPFCFEVCLWRMFLRLWLSNHPPEGIKIIVTYGVQVLLYCLFKVGKHKKENRRRYVKERKWRIREKKRLEAQEAGRSNSAGTCSDSAGWLFEWAKLFYNWRKRLHNVASRSPIQEKVMW